MADLLCTFSLEASLCCCVGGRELYYSVVTLVLTLTVNIGVTLNTLAVSYREALIASEDGSC